MTYRLSNRSLERLEGVHPKLVEVVKRAIEISTVDFIVIEGVRSLTQQRENVKKGASKTMNSKHLIQPTGYGHAVDLGPLINGKIPWEDLDQFRLVSRAMKNAAEDLGVKITWGGDWTSFYDGPHYQIEL